MRVFMQIVSGPYEGRAALLETDETCRVGRGGAASLILADDARLSPVHFALTCGADGCHLFDWGSEGGTYVNDVRVYETVLSNGDRVTAGATTLVVYVETGDFAGVGVGVAGTDASATPLSRLLRLLRDESAPVFALLDAARDPQVLELLGGYAGEHQSLYNGEAAEELAEVAPYLVSLPAGEPLLEKLLYHGWGKSWGVYFTSAETFAQVRRHLRSLQFVEDEGGDELYFRFYDPRVLRVFLPCCTQDERASFLGPVSTFYVEAEEPVSLLKLTGNEDLIISLNHPAG